MSASQDRIRPGLLGSRHLRRTRHPHTRTAPRNFRGAVLRQSEESVLFVVVLVVLVVIFVFVVIRLVVVFVVVFVIRLIVVVVVIVVIRLVVIVVVIRLIVVVVVRLVVVEVVLVRLVVRRVVAIRVERLDVDPVHVAGVEDRRAVLVEIVGVDVLRRVVGDSGGLRGGGLRGLILLQADGPRHPLGGEQRIIAGQQLR
ncbi:hypothetical protein, partial [Microbacterium sp.]|uniref:hypothetical protein n=1 Tax=Microbacterium sp. TaxID=51671 RepID=UPI002812820C